MIEPVWTGLDFASGPEISAVVVIDCDSDAGAWARAIEITPHLAAQVHEIARGDSPLLPAREGEAAGVTPSAASPFRPWWAA